MKVGILGIGCISLAHIPGWERLEGVELVALCDVRPEMMESYPDKHCYTSFDEMLDNEELDIIDICLPTYLHAEYAIKAMKRGINVLCEKPVSLCPDDVALLYRTAEENGVKFMVAQVLRFWREYDLIKKYYDEGTYGGLLSGHMYRLQVLPGLRWENWILDEGKSGLALVDFHIHDLDFMAYAFGLPKSFKRYRSVRGEQDAISAVYDFGDFFISAEASFYNGTLPFCAGFRFQFERAVVVWENGVFTVYEEGCDAVRPLEGLGSDKPYQNEIEYFADCVASGRSPDKVKPEELEAVLKILME